RRDCNAVSPVERAPNFSFSEHDYGSDGLAFVHEVEGLVDAVERHGVGDHRVDLDLPVHVPVDDLGGVGAPAGAAEGRTLPHPPGDQLERPGGDLLAGLGHADDDRGAPAAVAGLQRLAHDGGVAGAVEGVVGPAVGEGHEVGDDVAPTTFLSDLLRVDEVGHAEAAAPLLL